MTKPKSTQKPSEGNTNNKGWGFIPHGIITFGLTLLVMFLFGASTGYLIAALLVLTIGIILLMQTRGEW